VSWPREVELLRRAGLRSFASAVRFDANFAPEGQRVDIYGVCRRCRAAATTLAKAERGQPLT
jgi:hypothetical protein